jgi:ABC-type transport system involved in Fe-S cluster assembly fused permease/ATPase subunit
LKRKTGTVLRAVDRGTKAMSQLCTFFLFNIAPIFLDVLFVSSFMLAKYTVWITVITLVVIVIYVVFTIGVTEVRK